MPKNDNEGRFAYIQLYFDDVERYNELLTDAELGQLLCAVVRYSKTGVKESVPEAIKWPYSEQRQKIDGAHRKHQEKCAQNALNGAKGGRAKAENARTKQESKPLAKPAFAPPTKTEFRNAARDMRRKEDIDYTDGQLDDFYDALRDEGWKINNTPIESRTIWKNALLERFASVPYTNNLMDWTCWCYLYAASHAQVTSLYDFMESYNEDLECWDIAGKKYSCSKWRDAADAYLATLANATSDSKC